jgi:hypothetical protein
MDTSALEQLPQGINMTYRYTTKENPIINSAIKILKYRVCDSELVSNIKDLKQYFQLAIANEPDK